MSGSRVIYECRSPSPDGCLGREYERLRCSPFWSLREQSSWASIHDLCPSHCALHFLHRWELNFSGWKTCGGPLTQLWSTPSLTWLTVLPVPLPARVCGPGRTDLSHPQCPRAQDRQPPSLALGTVTMLATRDQLTCSNTCCQTLDPRIGNWLSGISERLLGFRSGSLASWSLRSSLEKRLIITA